MSDQNFWETRIGAMVYAFVPYRPVFLHVSEIAEQWVWLALESGRFRFRVGRGKNALEGECGPGDWVLCPPGEAFSRWMMEPAAFHYARFSCTGQGLFPFRGAGTLRDAARLRANFAALKASQSQASEVEWSRHLLTDIFCHAHRELRLLGRPLPDDPLMEAARSRLERELGAKLSMAAVARDFRLTPPEFSRRYRAAFGQSPREFLLEKRLDLARQLLLETDLTVAAVATRCGFASGFYFSRFWSKRYAGPPARFRRAHRL